MVARDLVIHLTCEKRDKIAIAGVTYRRDTDYIQIVRMLPAGIRGTGRHKRAS
jgi:hypothetical protein